MPFFHLRLSATHLPLNQVADALLRPFLGVPEYNHHQSKTLKWNVEECFQNKISVAVGVGGSLRFQPVEALQTSTDEEELSSFFEFQPSKVGINLFEKAASREDAEVESSADTSEDLSDKYHKEEQRRRKIGLANRGKVPWNKGRKHTKETRMRIKQRTREALRNPKVKVKMCHHPRVHSDHSKEKIRSSLRRIWDKRLRWRQLNEEFLSLWSEKIAEAAKKGGSDQQELDWDSYEKIKQDIALVQVQLAADKAKEKKVANIIAQKAAAEKMARMAEKRKEHKAQEKAIREMRRILKKAERDKRKLELAQELNLKRRLIKIRKKRSLQGRVAIEGETVVSVIPDCEKLDIELIKQEKSRRKVSLADQIKAAKNKRTDSMVEVLASSSALYQTSTRLE